MNTERQNAREAIVNHENQPLVTLMNELCSDNALSDHYADLVSDVELIADRDTFDSLEKEIEDLRAKANLTEQYSELKQINQAKNAIQERLLYDEDYRRYRSLKNRIDTLTQLNKREILSTDPVRETLLQGLSTAVGVNSADRVAPFANFQENTSDKWQYVPDQAVKDYLDEMYFMDLHGFYPDGNKLAVHAADGEDILVPLSLLVNAAGFSSWQGRGEGAGMTWQSAEYGNGGYTSIDAIKHYAALPTEVPPVDTINVYIQPNGCMFADNNSGDSHRVSAAFLKGQQQISAKSVNFVQLSDNYLSY